MKKKKRGILAVVIALLGVCAVVSVTFSAVGKDRESENWEESKVGADLREAMEAADDETLIPVYVWLYDIDHSRISDTVTKMTRDPERPKGEKIPTKQEVSRRLHSEYTEQFISEHVNKDRKMIDVGEYITRVILEATKREIQYYTTLPEVSELGLYNECEDLIPLPDAP